MLINFYFAIAYSENTVEKPYVYITGPILVCSLCPLEIERWSDEFFSQH